jgi:hypothetical protein
MSLTAWSQRFKTECVVLPRRGIIHLDCRAVRSHSVLGICRISYSLNARNMETIADGNQGVTPLVAGHAN